MAAHAHGTNDATRTRTHLLLGAIRSTWVIIAGAMLAEKRFKHKWSEDPRNTRWSEGLRITVVEQNHSSRILTESPSPLL